MTNPVQDTNTPIDRRGGSTKPIIATVIALVAFGTWFYFGFPSPEVLLFESSARDQCVKLAEKSRFQVFFTDNGEKIRAVDSWIKNGKRVVQIGLFQTETTYIPRLCIVDRSTVQIVPLAEQGLWR